MKGNVTMRDFMVVGTSILAVLCVVFALLVLSGCSGQSEGTAAKFGDHTISEDEVTAYTDQFRSRNGLTGDQQWAAYLSQNGLTGKTWREQAIGNLADRILIQDKAEEYGITANEDEVDQQIAEAKQQAGIAEDDDQAWSDYLSKNRDTTPDEYRQDVEFSNIELQVFRKDLDITDDSVDQMCDDYIKNNLADQVVRHYSGILYKKADEAKAEKALRKLKTLDGDELSSELSEMAEKHSADKASALIKGDIGWDFIYDEQAVDPKLKLRKAKLKSGELYGSLLKGSDGYWVIMCTGRGDFSETPHYADIKDDALKNIVYRLAMQDTWSQKCQQYLSDLEQQANIQVSQMPSGLSYDLVEDDGASGSSSADSSTNGS